MPRRYRKPTKARPARPRLRGAACRHPQRLLGRDRLCSAGSVRSQADEARRHAGSRTSGNGPDTAERAPLDARGWVPSVFRARPAESGCAMPATPRMKDRLTCAWGLQPRGRKDATRLGQMVEVADAAMIGRPRATGPTPRALPRTRCPRRRGRGAAQKRKRQSVNRMRHRRRARPRRPARATGQVAGHRAGLCYGFRGLSRFPLI